MSLRRKFFNGHHFRELLLVFSFCLLSCSRLNFKSDLYGRDNFWSDITNESIVTKKSIFKVLEKKYPNLLKQIQSDSSDLSLLGFWGKSLNFDSGAKKQILEDQIIFDLEMQFGLPKDSAVVHAGIMHTYGYLFSTLLTPYGYKRKRWIEPTLNYAFSFKDKGLSPETKEGTLLSNVTYFAGKIAFKNEGDRALLSGLKNVSPEVLNFNYSLLSAETLEEEIELNGAAFATLRTTLLPLPKKLEGEENDYLLIYSIFDFKLGKEFLITAFPIRNDAYKKIVSPESLGHNQSISIRYNAYLDGSNQKWIGVRKLSKTRLRP